MISSSSILSCSMLNILTTVSCSMFIDYNWLVFVITCEIWVPVWFQTWRLTTNSKSLNGILIDRTMTMHVDLIIVKIVENLCDLLILTIRLYSCYDLFIFVIQCSSLHDLLITMFLRRIGWFYLKPPLNSLPVTKAKSSNINIMYSRVEYA